MQYALLIRYSNNYIIEHTCTMYKLIFILGMIVNTLKYIFLSLTLSVPSMHIILYIYCIVHCVFNSSRDVYIQYYIITH